MLEEIEQRGKPAITLPDAPADELGITDDVEGAGAEVAPGAVIEPGARIEPEEKVVA